MQLSGTVTSGLGRAHVFMAQSHYQEQFKTVLGSGAWPGTLNVDILDENISTYRELRILAGLEEGETSANIESIRIAGFERDGTSFGGATAFPASISSDERNWIECAILIPDLTRHTKTAEVISSDFNRDILQCSKDEMVTLHLG